MQLAKSRRRMGK